MVDPRPDTPASTSEPAVSSADRPPAPAKTPVKTPPPPARTPTDGDRPVELVDADRPVDLVDDDVPVLPEQTRDDTDRGWGDQIDSNDDRLLADRPPHWG